MRSAPERSVLILGPHPFYTERGAPIAVRDLAAILATRILSHTQILGEDEACWVEPNPESIATGLEKLTQGQLWRVKLGERSAELSRASFSRDRLREKILSSYDELRVDETPS